MMNKLIQKYRSTPEPVKASVWFVICGFLQRAISLLTMPVFSRLLSTTEYGLFSVYTAWSNVILIFASLNLASGIYVRGLIKYEQEADEFTASLQSLYVFNMTLVFLIYLIFSDFWSGLIDLPKSYMFFMFIDMYMTTAFHFWSARQRVEYKYRSLIILTLFNTIAKPTLGITAILYAHDKVLARIVTIVVADILVFGGVFFRMFIGKGKRFSTKYWKYALAYNLPLVPHYLSQIVLNQSDSIMIKSMDNAGNAGIYSLAYSSASVLLIVNQSILNSYNPWMYKQIKSEQYKDINTVSIILLIIIAVLNLLLIGFAPEVIAILAPQEYYQAIWVIPPVSMSVYFVFMYSLFSNFEFYFEKTRHMMYASVGGAVLNIVLNFIFIQKYGYMAAGYTTLICYLFYCIFHYYIMKFILAEKLGGKRIYDIRVIMVISGLFGFGAFGLMFLYKCNIIRYFVLLVIFIIAFKFRKGLITQLKITRGV